MPSNITHQGIHARWKLFAHKVRRAKNLDHAVRDVMVETVRMCQEVRVDVGPEAVEERLDFLFVDPQHGLAGWTTEAL